MGLRITVGIWQEKSIQTVGHSWSACGMTSRTSTDGQNEGGRLVKNETSQHMK